MNSDAQYEAMRLDIACLVRERDEARALLRYAVSCSEVPVMRFGGEPGVIYDGSNLPRSWFEEAKGATNGL